MVERDVCDRKTSGIVLALEEIADVAALPALIYELRALEKAYIYEHGRLRRSGPEGALQLRVKEVSELKIQKHIFLRVYDEAYDDQHDNAREKQTGKDPKIMLYEGDNAARHDEDNAEHRAYTLDHLICTEPS